LLTEAVQRIKKDEDGPFGEVELSFQILRPLVKIDLPLPVGIPDHYIPDRSVRLSLYRRAAAIMSSRDIDELRKEFKDRFGSLPETVSNLLTQLELKLLAEKAGIETISVQNNQITLGYPEDMALPQPWEFDVKIRFGESTVWLPIDLTDGEWVTDLKRILEGLVAY
jgi:transcription-repair coupling factor (superfamily II helicase)